MYELLVGNYSQMGWNKITPSNSTIVQIRNLEDDVDARKQQDLRKGVVGKEKAKNDDAK